MENGETFTLPSGATLHVSITSFEKAKALQDAVLVEVRGKGVGKLDAVEILKAAEGAGQEGLNVIVDKALGLASSKEIESAVFECAERATYALGGPETAVPVTRRLFDDPGTRDAARGDFYEICLRVTEVNTKSFMKALFSLYAARAAKSASTRESSSGPESAKPRQ